MKRIIVHATDKDVLVLAIVTAISMIRLEDCTLLLAFGHGTHFRYIGARVLASKLGNTYCRGLPVHACMPYQDLTWCLH